MEENVWVCTDPDSNQYLKTIGNRRYLCVELVWLDLCKGDVGYPDKDCSVKTAFIDLNDYSDQEIEAAVVPFYGSVKDMMETYGPGCARFEDDLITECIFEQMGGKTADMSELMTRTGAEEYIKKYIKEH